MSTSNEPQIPLEEPLEPGGDDRALALRDPSSTVTIDQLQSLRGVAVEILEARAAILETARRRAIRMTHPEDWVLFKSPDGRVTAYLQDAGCDRVRDILGIEVYDITAPEKIPSLEGGSFLYLISGSGHSRLTLQRVEAMEGGRSSGDDFCKGKTGAELELLVRKAARANLDGNITRELTGLKTVPLGELVASWAGQNKNPDHCRKGRGFGSGDERHGARREGSPDLEPPVCPVCPPVNGAPVKLLYRAAKGDRKPFYGCPHYDKHPATARRVIVDAAEWEAGAEARAAATNGGAATGGAAREPGSDG